MTVVVKEPEHCPLNLERCEGALRINTGTTITTNQGRLKALLSPKEATYYKLKVDSASFRTTS